MLNLLPKRKSRENFIDEFFNTSFLNNKVSFLKSDLKDTKDGYSLDVEIPGFNKDEIKLSYEDGYLTISAKKEQLNKHEKNESFVSKESNYQMYVGTLKEEEIHAKLNNGVLSISYPKSNEEIDNNKYISIE